MTLWIREFCMTLKYTYAEALHVINRGSPSSPISLQEQTRITEKCIVTDVKWHAYPNINSMHLHSPRMLHVPKISFSVTKSHNNIRRLAQIIEILAV
jgi:hypothetical protein